MNFIFLCTHLCLDKAADREETWIIFYFCYVSTLNSFRFLFIHTEFTWRVYQIVPVASGCLCCVRVQHHIKRVTLFDAAALILLFRNRNNTIFNSLILLKQAPPPNPKQIVCLTRIFHYNFKFNDFDLGIRSVPMDIGGKMCNFSLLKIWWAELKQTTEI